MGRRGSREWKIVSHLEEICIPEKSAILASACALHKTVKRLAIKACCLCCHCWRLDKAAEALCSWQLEPGGTFNTAAIIETCVCAKMANSLNLSVRKLMFDRCPPPQTKKTPKHLKRTTWTFCTDKYTQRHAGK